MLPGSRELPTESLFSFGNPRPALQEERRSNRELGIKPDEDDEVIEDNISGLNNEDDRGNLVFPGRDTIRRQKRRGSVSKKLVYATARGPMVELLAMPELALSECLMVLQGPSMASLLLAYKN